MAKNKTPQGEMRNVGGAEGATLSVIREEPQEPGPTGPAEPVIQVQADPPKVTPKKANVRVHVETGWFDIKADSLEEAKDRADTIIHYGVIQPLQNGLMYHPVHAVQRVIVTEQ